MSRGSTRYNEIQNRCNKLTPSQKLPYLKLLFTKFYQGIPKADDELVLARVDREWKLALDARSQKGTSFQSSQKTQGDQAEIQRLRAELKAEKARKAGASGETSGAQTCFLCIKGSDHQIKNCPFAYLFPAQLAQLTPSTSTKIAVVARQRSEYLV